jgi:hypothetical protein
VSKEGRTEFLRGRDMLHCSNRVKWKRWDIPAALHVQGDGARTEEVVHTRCFTEPLLLHRKPLAFISMVHDGTHAGTPSWHLVLPVGERAKRHHNEERSIDAVVLEVRQKSNGLHSLP